MYEAVVKAVIDKLSTPGDLGSSLLPGGLVFLADAQINILNDMEATEAGLGAAVIGLGLKKVVEAIVRGSEDRLRRRMRMRAIHAQAEEADIRHRRQIMKRQAELERGTSSDYSEEVHEYCFSAARELAEAGDVEGSKVLARVALEYQDGRLGTGEALLLIRERYVPRTPG